MQEEDESTSTKSWRCEIKEELFQKLKTQERFWQLVALARAVNALRFAHTTLLAHDPGDDSVRAMRTRYNSFFLNCALLYECLLLIERMGKHFHGLPEYSELCKLLKGTSTAKLRQGSLNNIRNQLTFHFSEKEIGEQLTKTNMVPRFVVAEGKQNVGVYYELADLCAMGAFADASLDASSADQDLAKKIGDVTELANRFTHAAEVLIGEVLKSDGWTFVE